MQLMPFNPEDDPVIDALRAEGAADPDVIGIVAPGSRRGRRPRRVGL